MASMLDINGDLASSAPNLLKNLPQLSQSPGKNKPNTNLCLVSKKRRENETRDVTLILVNLAGIMERADESLLPGVYKEIGAALHADPTRLGSLTLSRSIVQSLCYPLAAYLAVSHNRTHVIAYGAFLWAAATFLVGFSSTLRAGLVPLPRLEPSSHPGQANLRTLIASLRAALAEAKLQSTPALFSSTLQFTVV